MKNTHFKMKWWRKIKKNRVVAIKVLSSVLMICGLMQAKAEVSSYSKEFRIHLLGLSTPSEVGKRSSTYVPSSTYVLTLLEQKRVSGLPQRERHLELSPDNHLVVMAFDANGQEIAGRIVSDPRLIRAEDFEPSTGTISLSKLIYQEDVELRVTMPDDPKIAKLRVYYPQWDGTNFSFELMGEIELTPEQEISTSVRGISPVVPVTTILNNGDSANRIDLSILGDGYTASDLSQYASDVQNAIDGLFDSEPFKEYQNYFNVHRLDVTSNESGADHPSDTPPKYKDTALDATYNCAGSERRICVNHGKVNNILFDSVQPNQRDMVLILVNDTKYGGSGGIFAVASIHNSVIELVLHELGHSFGLLADEYDYGNCYNAFEPWQPNVTKEINRHLIKWNVGGGPPTGWIDLATPIPTFGSIPGVPGLYEGAKYCRTGLYRPTYNSKMRSLGRPFEQINEEQLIKRIYHFVSPLDSSRPVNTHITLQKGQNQNFEANVLNPLNHSLNIEWMVDGEYISSGSDFTLNSTYLSLGNHAVEVIISDPTTKVRYDPNNVLKEIRSWEVKIDPLNTVQFTLASYSVAENGGQVSIIATRVGDSNGAISVNYASSDNTATAGSDYTATSGTLNWSDGDATDKSFTITISDDGKSEGPETFTITLYDPVSGESLDNAIVTISDNDTTIVNLVKFTATALETGVLLEWQTVSEIDTEGFYILRATGEGWKTGDYSTVIRLIDQPIPVQGNDLEGSYYSYSDYNVERGVTYYYALVDIDLHGKSTIHLNFIDSATAK